ncbi:hypothetical protein [Maribellus sediminis]|uniref:hypothetical protein n=1 Tax=Maribellus sediminis TaxID=2696285 RepID=UPI0014321358|nr:hypothetical protein [Maribellus sediminis]
MKKCIFLLSFVFVLFISNSVSAQIQVPTKAIETDKSLLDDFTDSDFSKDILKALDPGKSFTSPDKLLKLLGNNKDYVSNILGVVNGSGTEDEKTTKINALQSERKDFIENLLGEGKAADYYKLIKNNIEPLTKKYKLAKLFL